MIESSDNKDKFKKLYNENIRPKNFVKKIRKNLIVTFLSIFLSFLAGITLSVGYILINNLGSQKFSNNIDSDSVIVSSSYDNSDDEPNIKSIIKSATPSVVSITTTSQVDNIFSIPMETEGAGSGVIFHRTSTNTYILTNNHVIDGAMQVGIAIDESEPIYATLVGKDSNSDLAVISVLNSDLDKAGIKDITIATFGNSDNMNEGDSVIAIGNSLGEGKTATLGIISSTSKEISIDGKTLNVLQTTAAINPGNSGGALINSKGEVIGINTAKVADTSVNGIGYSISTNIAMPIIENIMNKSNAPALDVYIANANQYSEDGLTFGALVVDIIRGGAADKAGILPNDIITSIDDTPIFDAEQLSQVIKNYKIGDSVKVNIIRGKEILTIKVKLRESVNNNSNF